MEHVEAGGRWWKRIGWLLFLWLLGVGALGVVSLLLKLAMRFAGFSGPS